MPEDQTQTQAPPPIRPLNPLSMPPPLNPEGQARTWNMLCHLSALAGFFIPFGNFLGPLLVWQIKKQEIPSVESHGKAALNFQITVLIALLAGVMAAIILSFFCIGFLLVPVLILVSLCAIIFPVIAAIKASNGEDYKYPYSIEFLK